MRNLLLLKKDKPGRRAKQRKAFVGFCRFMAVLNLIIAWGAWGKVELGIWPAWIPLLIDLVCFGCIVFFVWISEALDG